MTTLKPRPLWRPLDSLRTSMVKQVFAKEHFTHKKGLLFTPTVHTDEGMQEAHAHSASDAAAQAPDETAQASPHTQDLQTAAAAEAADVEAIRAQAFADGLAQGLAQGQAQANETQAANEQEALAAQAHAETQALLQAIDEKVDALIEDPAQLQEPLKRLALHLAEQLVLAELSLSPQAVAHLIERCMDTLDASDPSAIVVELNPQDLALLNTQQRAEGQPKPAWRLQADAVLLPGSVRVRADDSVVSDLIENRLESLAHSLLTDPKTWQEQSAFAPAKLASRLTAQRGSAQTVEDAQAKPRAMNTPLAQASDTELRAEFANETLKHSALSDEQAAFEDLEAEPLDAEDYAEKHTYEAHEVMAAPAASPQAVMKQFEDALTDITLQLDKLDD
jgi:flagellar biosynthesis/type III secretory pathway protein FliH